MLEYDRINISEEIDVNKTNASRECNIYHNWYFSEEGYKNEPYLSIGCHDLMQKAISFNDLSLVSIKRRDYRIYFWYMSKDDARNTMKNSHLNQKSELS